MYNLEVMSVAGEKASASGTATVDPAKLGGKVRTRLVQEACVMYEANKRVGTAKTKTRAELAYANKKPWRQKGTGRARAGTRRSPIWRGGGTVFGPIPRDHGYAIPTKARRRATQSALLSKFRDGEVTLVSGIEIKEGKTKEVAAALKKLGLAAGKVLLVIPAYDEKLHRAARNIENLTVLPASDLNAYELLKSKRLLMTKPALDKALELFGEDKLGTQKETE
ncbi:MAG TPA: 50S ribosomal protein L4 [Planctomycetota bacterium]|nr:50S ribosomal protein L4 [Planctomycetota bacterium]